MDYKLLKYFTGYKLLKVKVPMRAIAAFDETQAIEHETEITLPEPLNTKVKVYLVHDLDQILIGEQTLREWRYSIDEEGSKVCLSNNKCILLMPNYPNKKIQKKEVYSMQIKTTKTQTTNSNSTYKTQLINKYPELFSTENRKPKDRTFKYHILTEDEIPVFLVPYFATHEEQKVIEEFITEKKKAGILVDEIPGSWLSPIFTVKQKTKYRVVVDLRRINAKTVKQPVYLPTFKDLINVLKNLKYFSVFDLKAAYHQIAVDEETSKKFGIITPCGNFNFTTLPFGAVNSPFVFSSFLNRILPKQNVFAYMDDILIHTTTMKLHKQVIEQVCRILNQNGLQMNMDKTQFIQRQVKFLGYQIAQNAIAPTEDKIRAIQNWNIPRTTTEVCSIVNFTNFFRNFIPNMSSMTGPLNDLLKDIKGKRKPINHNPQSIEAFNKLKKCLVHLPTLATYKPDQITYVFSDCSDEAMGGVICQLHTQGNRNYYLPISFASFKLNLTQKRYSAMEKELLSIITILKKFNYICNGKIIVFTDHQSLSILQSKTSNPPMRIARFLDVLGAYSPEIRYLPGKKNYVADILSRYQTMNIKDYADEAETTKPIFTVSIHDLNDNNIEDIKNHFEEQSKEVSEEEELPYEEFKLVNGELKVIIKNRLIDVVSREKYKDHATKIHNLHHPSIRVTDYLSQMSLWHPDHKLITTDIINHCPYCQTHSTFSTVQRELYILEPLHAFERWGLDFVILNEQQGKRYVLVAVEYITGLVYAMATTSMEAVHVYWLIKWIYQIFGKPTEIITDNGTSFVNESIKTLCDQLNIQHKLASNYHPMTNGRVEKANGLLKKILKGLTNGTMTDWPDFLEHAVNIYNSTPSIFNRTPLYLAIGKTTPMNEFGERMYQEFQTENNDQRNSEEANATDIDNQMIRLYELEMMNKDREINTDLKKRRMTMMNLLKKPFGIPAGYAKGEWVLKKKRKKKKTDPDYDGPYQIVKVNSNDAYTLRNKNGREEKGTYNGDMLRPAYMFEDSPIQAASNWKRSLQEVEKKLLTKIVDEMNQSPGRERG